MSELEGAHWEDNFKQRAVTWQRRKQVWTHLPKRGTLYLVAFTDLTGKYGTQIEKIV